MKCIIAVVLSAVVSTHICVCPSEPSAHQGQGCQASLEGPSVPCPILDFVWALEFQWGFWVPKQPWSVRGSGRLKLTWWGANFLFVLGCSSHQPENPLGLTLATGMEWRVWGQVEGRVTSEEKVVDVAGKILPGREVCVGCTSSDFLTPNQRWSHKATIITIINKRTVKTNTHDSRHLRNCSYIPGTALLTYVN